MYRIYQVKDGMYENFIEKHIASSVRDNGASFAALNVVGSCR